MPLFSRAVPPFPVGPPGYGRLESDVEWDPGYLESTPPERILTFDEFGAAAGGPTAFSEVAMTTPLKFLSDEGVRIVCEVCAELEQYARTSQRIAKFHRGGAYRSRFLWGMTHDPTLLAWMRGLARAPLEPHPVTHHGVHINFAPDEIERSVDTWHTDSTSFDYVLAASDPRSVRGGRSVYYRGPVEEGRAILDRGEELPRERITSPQLPGPGWAILQQGHRILHRTEKLEEPGRLATLIVSYYTAHPTLPDPTESKLPNLRRGDSDEIGLVEGARFAAVVGAHRLLQFAETKADFSLPPPQVQAELRASVALVEQAIGEFDRELDAQTSAEGARPGAAGFLSQFDPAR